MAEKGQTTVRRVPLYVTWAATAASVVLGVLPLALRGSRSYDPMVALGVAGSIGLAWYTYFTRQGVVDAQSREDRSRTEQRSGLATAVLAELQVVVARLHAVAQHGASAATADFISAPVLEHACDRSELFTAKTVQALLGLRRRLQDVQIFLDDVKRIEQRAARHTTPVQSGAHQVLVDRSTHLKVRARWACNASNQLVEALQSEGGMMPEPFEAPVSAPDEILLLPNPFEPKA